MISLCLKSGLYFKEQTPDPKFADINEYLKYILFFYLFKMVNKKKKTICTVNFIKLFEINGNYFNGFFIYVYW
jgi:hypothetical protein